MKKIMEMLQNMKAKNEKKDNKGFSLVELIIVIAIMAILVGVVGTQVLPYLNKSKLEKDRQVISSYSTAAVTAYSMVAGDISALPAGDIEVYKTPAADADSDEGKIVAKIKELTGDTNPVSSLKSKEAKGASDIIITYDATNHKVTATVKGTSDTNPTALAVVSTM